MVDNFNKEDRFSRISILFSFVVLAVGGLFGIIQLLNRTPYFPKFIDASTYYLVLTGHGVLLAIAWTAFFIMGVGVILVTRETGLGVNSFLLNLSLILSLIGTLMAAAAILSGNATVLYTFYAPLYAHPIFYIGAALLIFGTWIYAVAIFQVYLRWRKLNPGKGAPLATLGVVTTLIIWLEATPILVIDVLKNFIPMSIYKMPVDALEARTLFWYFGHPLVYFWILPAIAFWYYGLPRLLGTKLFSVKMAKVAYILFILVSTPVGLHHQLVDPGASDIAKFIHVIFTYVVASPSLLTAFNVTATLIKAGRERGGKGLFGWIVKLPWDNPIFAAIGFSIILFGMGGISGIINASYVLNYVVHNTIWIVGHFHLTVATAATLTFMGASYLIIPMLFNKNIKSVYLARLQPYLWFIGMFIFSLAYHIGGVFGAPRRTYDVLYGGLIPKEWIYTLGIGAVGGIVFWVSGVIFIIQMLLTLSRGTRLSKQIDIKFTPMDYEVSRPSILDRLGIWIIIAALLIFIGYSIPLYDLYTRGLAPYPPISPFGGKV